MPEFVVFLFAMKFHIVSDFKPTGDQPEAIRQLVEGLESRDRFQTLLGVTGSGKTFTVANVIEKVQRPTLVLAHNKTLAAQLYAEFKQFFPENAVEYFVSYYDYYQPEAYIPTTGTYIEKDLSINEEIDGMYWSLHLFLVCMGLGIRLNFEKTSSGLKWGKSSQEQHFYIGSCKVFILERLPIFYMELFVSKEIL